MELPGGPFVTMSGTTMMLLLSADNLGLSHKVSPIYCSVLASTTTGILLR